MADVTVTREDRVAGAALFDLVSDFRPVSAAAQHILDGKGDGSPFVQALAAHRAAERERCAGIAETWTRDDVVSAAGYFFGMGPEEIEIARKTAAGIATAIRGSESNGADHG